ncbi:hypothetical protein D9M71_81310 [compost metagenome]
MEQAVGLVGAPVDHHAGGQGLVVVGLEADVQAFADGVLQVFVELRKIRGLVPQAHGVTPGGEPGHEVPARRVHSCQRTASWRSSHSGKRLP